MGGPCSGKLLHTHSTDITILTKCEITHKYNLSQLDILRQGCVKAVFIIRWSEDRQASDHSLIVPQILPIVLLSFKVTNRILLSDTHKSCFRV